MRFFVLLCISICFTSIGQTIHETKNTIPYTFYNHERQKFTIIEDSTGCLEYNEQTKKWEFRKIVYQLQEPFKNFLLEYNLLHEKGSKVFFIDRGCGYVYILENDTLKRHDRSFHHKNQYGGTLFLYQGQPHIFGGYGLFTMKNIITYYNLKEREWFVHQVSGELPKPKYQAHGMQVGDCFYVAAGLNDNGKYYDDVWMFDFTKLKWSLLGKIKKSLFNYTFFTPDFRGRGNLSQQFISSGINLFELDYPNKQIIKYPMVNAYILKNVCSFNNLVIYSKLVNDELTYQVIVENKADFFKNKKEIISLLVDNPKQVDKSSLGIVSVGMLIFVLLALIILFIIIYIKKRRSQRFIDISPSEKELLELMCLKGEEGIEISEVSDFVNSDNPSIDTLKKRREGLIKSLKIKISQDAKIPIHEVIMESKSAQDKRIKILVLNSKAIEKYRLIATQNRRK
jgi:hypothetical protein